MAIVKETNSVNINETTINIFKGSYDEVSDNLISGKIKDEINLTNISSLPPEMFYRIFQYLPLGDLKNCLEVNEQWKNNANRIKLWEVICKNHDLEPEEELEKELPDYRNLCRPARTWFSFLNSVDYNWQKNNYQILELKNVKATTIFKNVHIVCSELSGSVVKIVKLGKPFNEFYLKQSMICSYLDSNKNFIVFKLGSAIVVYKFEENQMVKHLGYDTKRKAFFCDDEEMWNEILTEAPSYQPIFQDHIIKIINHRILVQNQINEDINVKYWIDLRTKMIKPINHRGKIISITKNHLIIDQRKTINNSPDRKIITVCDHEGSNEKTFELGLVHFKASKNFFIGYRSNGKLEVRGLETGERFLSDWVLKCGSYLHPSRNILYTCERHKIKAISINTGETLWENTDIIIDGPMYLSVVCERYLVVYQFESHCLNPYVRYLDALELKQYVQYLLRVHDQTIYILNAKYGKCLNKIEIKGGNVLKICDDHILIQKESCFQIIDFTL